MSSKRTLLFVITFVLCGALFASYFTTSPTAQAQAPVATPNGGCVSYGTYTALSMCLHKFSDGTRCVATGGGGQNQGAAAALQCDFN